MKKNKFTWSGRPTSRSLQKCALALCLIGSLDLLGCKEAILENSETNELKAYKPNTKSDVGILSTGSDFCIAVIPDTQYYTAGVSGGTDAMFNAQVNWIVNNRVAENIKYVIHLGDVTDHGDNVALEWTKAWTALQPLETIAGLTGGLPYGVAVGNHDQTPNTGFPLTCTTTRYNSYYGRSHFAGRTYYGGNLDGSGSNNNDSHYDLFSGGGLDFIVIYLEYDGQNTAHTTTMNNWAYTLLGTYASRKGIVVTHNMVGNGDPAPFSVQGQSIYTKLKTRANLVMMLGGHHAGDGEGQRRDTYNKADYSNLTDYQGRVN
jgi:hypothetical protein